MPTASKAPDVEDFARLGEWPLDPAVTYLNHGGYGVTPLPVLAEAAAFREASERNPNGFITRRLAVAQDEATAAIAAALGTVPENLVLVENATAGINAVLRSLRLEPGDEVLITSLAYPAVAKAASFVAELAGARLIEVALPLPLGEEQAILAAIGARLSRRTRLVLFDHIASTAAAVLPVKALTELAQAAGARVLIDGAHAPGQLALDLAAIGADWYVGTLHKWYFAPRGCGLLWASPAVQRGLHPIAVSSGLGGGFHAEFDWTGTRDFSAMLAVPAGLAYHATLGGGGLMARNRALARWAAARLAAQWRSELAAPIEAFAAMASVRLPLLGAADQARAAALCRWLAERHRLEAAINAADGALWLRLSAQGYNTPADYERLASAFVGPAGDRP